MVDYIHDLRKLKEAKPEEDRLPSHILFPATMVESFNVIFLGSGVSTAIPTIRHVLDMNMEGQYQCPVCHHALSSPNSKNRRNNVSIAVVFEGPDGSRKCVMVDAGKTMRHACLDQLPQFGVSSVNALLLTHGHADAVLGLDDIRDLQISERVEVEDPANPGEVVHGFRVISGPLPIFMTQETMNTLSGVFPYLLSPPRFLDEANNVIERRIACIKPHVIEERCDLNIEGLPVHCFPVFHGGDYVSLGFNFGSPGQFVYISDVKIIPPESMEYLRSLPRIKTFVIDCLDHEGIWSHMGLREAISVSKELNPEVVYFTGMCCSFGLHDDLEALLLSMGLQNYSLAYDGLCLKF